MEFAQRSAVVAYTTDDDDYYCYSSTSYSSDGESETIRLLAKQLRHRGDLVHFRPPRKSLVNNERKIFRHFGAKERAAIAQFEYLNEMPTDVSGLASSPDTSTTKTPAPLSLATKMTRNEEQ